MLSPSIKSRPVYGTLSPQRGVAHVVVVDTAGAEAVADMGPACPPDFFPKATIFHVAPAQGATSRQMLRSLAPAALFDGTTFAEIAPKLEALLVDARMGTRIYTAGTEGIMGQTIALALRCGFERDAIVTEHRGSAARRVQCVHCKAFMEDVTTQPVACANCGLRLLVRDHYSYRLAAFQGVCIDAEEPGTAPPPEEIFR